MAQPQEWRGVRTIIEGTGAKLKVDNDEVLAETIGNVNGTGYFDAAQNPIGPWVVTEVLSRGTHLWNPQHFDPEGPFGTKMLAQNLVNGLNTAASFCLLVGYSPYTLEPVFAWPPKANASNRSHDDDTLSVVQLRQSPGEVIIGSSTILHYALSIPGNFRTFKKLHVTKRWLTAFTGGDLSVDQAKALTVGSCYSLYNGDAPVVVARINPATSSEVPNHIRPNMDDLQHPGQGPGPENRRLSEVLPRVEQYLLDKQQIKCFVYKAPYMSNLLYPPELYEELTKFAKAHPTDKFNAAAMLFAAQLWVDITGHPTGMMEQFASKANREIPPVSLPVFLVYFEHWLKIHEYLQCLQFIHPFRLIREMFMKDLSVSSELFWIKESVINPEHIRDLVLKAKSKHSEIPVGERVSLFPFMLSGTTMAHPQDMQQLPRLSPTRQAMYGIPDLRVLGLPSFHRQENNKRIIAMPKAIAQLSFHGIETLLYQPIPDGLLGIAQQGPTSQFGSSTKSGTIWTHEFQVDLDPTTLEERQWRMAPELIPGLPAETFIKPEMLASWFRVSDRRLAWLNQLGVLGQVQLRTGPDGLPGYNGMPLENEAHLIPPAAMASVLQRALQDPSNRSLMPEPVAPIDRLNSIMDLLRERPKLSHVVWKELFDQVEQMTVPGNELSILVLLGAMTDAKESFARDSGFLTDFIRTAPDDTALLLGQVTSWCAQYMCRMVRVPAATEADANWWSNEANREAARNHDVRVYIHVDGAHRRFSEGLHVAQREHNEALGKQLAGVGLDEIKALQGLHQNEAIFTAIEEQIEDLRCYIRSKGQGHRLT
ncbi:hypothetical protein FSARC_3540 [Fusarium sarcochroum]|uniref:Uncharacterized protein n=1 Tax=Fusarium sarcochroum TaxID=1208366 RepID=A0A8H4U3W9_9HYPO|nr:hypothetical protein FSARC_3540 [Fusarium sarcochroum]